MKKETIKRIALDILIFTLLINVHAYREEVKATNTIQSKGKLIYENNGEQVIVDTTDHETLQTR